jgi:TolB protein
MKNNRFFPFLILFFFPLFCEELEITLPTQHRESKVYISGCISDSKELSSLINYVLHEDFTLDGRAKIIEKNPLLEKAGHALAYSDPIWKKQSVDYLILPSLKDKLLSFNLFNVRTNTVKTLESLELSDNKEENIFLLHDFSDFFMEDFLGSKGIASKKILFSFKPHKKESDEEITSWTAEIYQTDSLGLTSKRVTFDNNYSITPEFVSQNNKSQDHQFAYVTYKQGLAQIYQGSLNGSSGRPFIHLRGNQLLPKISYNGKYLCFVSDASGKSDIFLQELDPYFKAVAKPLQIYSGLNQTSACPHLSPDNKTMAFVTNKSNNPMIYIASIDNTLKTRETPKLELISTPCDECSCPSYSSDGKMIAFSGRINGRRQIWVYDIESKRAHQLTTCSSDKENPCFGADNRHIVYNSTSPTTDLYILEIGQKKIRRLTQGLGDKHYPSFEK